MSSTSPYTPIDEIDAIISQTRTNYKSSPPTSYQQRLKNLKALKAMLENHTEDFNNAMIADLRQNKLLCMSEISGSMHEIDWQIANLKRNMQVKSVHSTSVFSFPGSCEIVPEPLGLALIISPWNYPLTLVFKPLAGAIAAGNAVIVKPSEISANCTKLFAELIPKYLDQTHFRIITGAADETTQILKSQFDYIFYTGNPFVAKIIAKAAAEYLTPVTLELGGKSPCYIDESASWSVMLKRLTWGKMLNCSQTCVTPDYILVKRSVRDRLVQDLKKELHTFYGDNPQENPDYSRIISDRHCKRLQSLIEEVKDCVVHGGQVDLTDKYVAPTILLNPPLDAKVMQEEIFGPILPIIAVDDENEAIEFVNAREKPLALYVFSTHKSIVDKFIAKTSSGGFCSNDVAVHVVVPQLPFGGVGNSGMGAYNGDYTFNTFSHLKSVVRKQNWMDSALRYPPYTDRGIQLLNFLNKIPPPNFGKIFRMMMPVGAIAIAWWYFGQMQH
uniref:Aldehyde dehydrogenase n=1 Tax=Percolomonas cosmopolitus TaxID=63605 RepID=A0A7S1KPK8_9EUKA|eukprot:CAMPEP_0117443502 /NCGR_PEP_ID=MMETSP0759-20121206/4727_1 /TAXON_ID=63605 /ORGANISM="Percolomonas cosmopolitus, Strain WS" /LENGTH=499 /DNA_ID=CAMNT_0005235477 /DNA_START=8 /DNA_END=1507 /DNA_ORIENTATION=+